MESVKTAIDIWKNNIFPSIFPFFILSSLLINYGFIEISSYVFNPLMKLFGINSNISFIFIMSILSGFPSSSKYIKDLYNDNKISLNDSTKALMFTHFSNPLFIIGTISNLLNKNISLIILFSHYIGNIIIGILFRKYNYSYIKNNEKIVLRKPNSIGNLLSKSIRNSIETLLLILGSISLFSFFTVIITKVFHPDSITLSIISGILEITNGINLVSLLTIPIKYKAIIISMMLSFGGLSIHLQIKSILSDTSIKYYPYLLARIIHSFISGLIVFLIYK